MSCYKEIKINLRWLFIIVFFGRTYSIFIFLHHLFFASFKISFTLSVTTSLFIFTDKKLPKNEKLDKERSKSSSNSEAEFIHQHFEDSESDYDENNGTINFNIVDEDEDEVQP